MIPQVKTLPDPLINLGYDQVEERGVTYGFSQEIPFPGKLRLRGGGHTRGGACGARIPWQSLRIIARPKEAFYDLAFVHRSIETVEKNRRVLLDFAQTAEARYAVGRACSRISSGPKQRCPACWGVWPPWNNARPPCKPRSTGS